METTEKIAVATLAFAITCIIFEATDTAWGSKLLTVAFIGAFFMAARK